MIAARHTPRGVAIVRVRVHAPSGHDIMRWVARMRGFSVAEIQGESTRKPLVLARREIIQKIREAHPNWGSSRIAKIMNRNHTSILWALRGGRGKARGAQA